MEKIYIRSIDSYIDIEEFKKHYYQEGHVYKINKHNYQKCIGWNKENPIIESLIVLDNINGGDRQLIFHHEGLNIPSLDFVNDILSGKIIEVDPIKYDEIKNKIFEFSKLISNELETIL